MRHNSMPGALVQTNSVGMGDFSGSFDGVLSSHDFSGSVTASETSGSEVVFGREYFWLSSDFENIFHNKLLHSSGYASSPD